ncbi:hypothetical protein DFP72DRAFT_135208 [Ephemerocybe angulata]|uniref:DUF6534 domain-containing protein n=1 Tax=Ephemerocybe angulata TaxID=980116 RepID=A0A8H6I7V3_9AGAR|nr:hypothetical protein DFP72DRAFT_135208 [Tulosesus angulatus]
MATDIPSIELIVGPLIIGALLTYFFMGVYMVQLQRYVSLSKRNGEKRMVHVIVALTTILELLQLVFITHNLYQVVVVHFADISGILRKSPWTGGMMPALNGLVAFLVQIFRIWRIRTFMKSVWGTEFLTPIIFLLSFSQCGAAIAATMLFMTSGRDGARLVVLKPAVVTWISLTIACDTLVALSIVIPLLKYKRTSQFSRSREIIDAVVLKTVENGTIIVLFSIPYLIVFIKYPNTMIAPAFEHVLSRLYANVLLATLNGRQRLRETGDGMSKADTTPWVLDGNGFAFATQSDSTSQSTTIQPPGEKSAPSV